MKKNYNFFKVKYTKFNKKKKHGAYYTVKCMDCKNKFKIYIPIKSTKFTDSVYEIGGVVGERESWLELFRRIKLI